MTFKDFVLFETKKEEFNLVRGLLLRQAKQTKEELKDKLVEHSLQKFVIDEEILKIRERLLNTDKLIKQLEHNPKCLLTLDYNETLNIIAGEEFSRKWCEFEEKLNKLFLNESL